MKELEREILIIGAGPAGISAAIEAAKSGAAPTHRAASGAKAPADLEADSGVTVD